MKQLPPLALHEQFQIINKMVSNAKSRGKPTKLLQQVFGMNAAELTEKLIRADSRDADTIAEGERQINALKRKLETYKKDHRRAPAAAQVDQAVAERGVLLANENGWGERYAEILTKLRDHAAKRRFMQARKNVLFQCVTQAFEDTLMDPVQRSS